MKDNKQLLRAGYESSNFHEGYADTKAAVTKIAVFTLGCKVNQYESGAIAERLSQKGFDVCEGLVFADAYIINTCSVTTEADKKSRQATARVLKLNENALVYITGCSSQNDSNAFLNKKNVRIIGGTASKAEFADLVAADLLNQKTEKNAEKQKQTPKIRIAKTPEIFDNTLLKTVEAKTRAHLKIQDGCNNFCSYCIIPVLRGRSRSRNLDEIVLEAKKLEKITDEIVLTGINISSYKDECGKTLIDLIHALKDIKIRKRIGSLECGVITREFVEKMLDSGFCNHFHLSMQSGSSSVLKRMNRKYTAEEFLERVEIIKSIDPLSGITTDVIAGFAGETDLEHNETLQTIKKAAFSDMHIFPFSPRKGTKAAPMEQIDKETVQKRVKELTLLKDELKKDFLNKNKNLTVEAYFEDTENGFNIGYTRNYIKVYFDSADKNIGLKTVKLIEPFKDGMTAR